MLEEWSVWSSARLHCGWRKHRVNIFTEWNCWVVRVWSYWQEIDSVVEAIKSQDLGLHYFAAPLSQHSCPCLLVSHGRVHKSLLLYFSQALWTRTVLSVSHLHHLLSPVELSVAVQFMNLQLCLAYLIKETMVCVACRLETQMTVRAFPHKPKSK